MSYQHPLLPSITIYKRGESGIQSPFFKGTLSEPDGWHLDGNNGNEFQVFSTDPKGWAFTLSGDDITFTIPTDAEFLHNTNGGNAGRLYYGLHEDHTFEGAGRDAQYVLSHFQGGIQRRYEFSVRNVRPVAEFELEVDNDIVAVDASTSTDSDGSVDYYYWDWHGDGSVVQITTTPIVSHTYPEAGEYTIKLFVQDDGTGRSHEISEPVTVEFGIIGKYVDHAGTVYTANTVGSSVVVSRFKAGTDSRETLLTVAGAKSPSIFKVDGTFFLSYTDRASGNTLLVRSRNGAHSFNMPVIVYDPSYTNAQVLPLLDGTGVAVATKSNKVWFRRSLNMVDWSAAPVEIEPLAESKVVTIRQCDANGSSRLIASDGYKLAASKNGGLTWQLL